MAKLSRGLRLKNPGNIELDDDWEGLSSEQPDRRFCCFDSFVFGCRALLIILMECFNQGVNTPMKIVQACTGTNDKGYATMLANNLEISPDAEIECTRDNLLALARAIARHENGPQADEVINISIWEQAADELDV